MDIQIVNPLDYPGWDDSLLATPGYTFFHSSAWARVISESYQYTPNYFAVFNNGKFLALIPVMEVKSFLTGQRGVSLPFTDYCEPLIDEGVKFQDIYDVIIGYGRGCGWKFVDLRGGQSFFPDALPSISYFGHILTLSRDKDSMLSSFRDSTKRNIKKAIREGVQVKTCNSLESVKEFCRLNCITRKYHGLPPQPYHFFKNVYENVISKNLGFVVLAYYHNKAIASNIYFHFGAKAEYKYGASDMGFQHLRANNLIMWEAIKWYCQNGYTRLCLGRTDIEHEGLRQFKTGWSTKEYMINYYKYDLKNKVFIKNYQSTTAFSRKIFSRMPSCLLNIIGSLLYRHMG